ncbi:hypothetical protein C9374_007559 [Naegleria lovaniensis]|uniref:Uncharacterized protein n=1 Tax=Naegleria lovaniensis TaxID=51637 RepID=A0AA88GM01_NAELO|nr:uncharacterized protein C9374_007559 [Naegleria lovaniensis]KAG2378921.1 hypothetical protein C9374_007559 [Naegleria lovaniensis]
MIYMNSHDHGNDFGRDAIMGIHNHSSSADKIGLISLFSPIPPAWVRAIVQRILLFLDFETTFTSMPYVCKGWTSCLYPSIRQNNEGNSFLYQHRGGEDYNDANDDSEDEEKSIWELLLYRDYSSSSSSSAIKKLMERIEFGQVFMSNEQTRKDHATFETLYKHLRRNDALALSVRHVRSMTTMLTSTADDNGSIMTSNDRTFANDEGLMVDDENDTNENGTPMMTLKQLDREALLHLIQTYSTNIVMNTQQRIELFVAFLNQVDAYRTTANYLENHQQDLDSLVSDLSIIEETFKFTRLCKRIEEETEEETIESMNITRRTMQVEGIFVNWNCDFVKMTFIIDFPYSDLNPNVDIDMDVFYNLGDLISMSITEVGLENFSAILGKDLESAYPWLKGDSSSSAFGSSTFDDDDNFSEQNDFITQLGNTFIWRCLMGAISLQITPIHEYNQMTFSRTEDLYYFLKFGQLDIMHECMPRLDDHF